MRTRLAWGFLLLCAGWYVYDTVLTQIPKDTHSDFTIYYVAAQHVVHGESPFLSSGYIYPPLLALLLAPLGALDYVTARWVWFVFSHLCLLAAAWLVYRHLGGGLIAACSVALVWSGGRAAGEALGWGQAGPVLALLLAVAYTASGWRQGASLGLGFAVKLLPGPGAFALVLARAWRSLAAAAVTGALLVTLPWMILSFALSGPKAPPHMSFIAGTPAVLSWSLPSVALRFLDPPASGRVLPWGEAFLLESLQLPPLERLVSLGVAAVTFTAGLVALVTVTFGRVSRAQLPLTMAALMTLTLVACPVSWTHYQVLEFPGMALLVGALAQRRAWKSLAAALVCGIFMYPLPVIVLRQMDRANGNMWPNTPVANYFWCSTAAVAGLILYGVMLAEIARSGESVASRPQ